MSRPAGSAIARPLNNTNYLVDMRFILFRGFIYCGLILLSLGLFRTQVLEGERYRQMSEQNRIRLIPMEAPRGRVFDQRGHLLAGNRISYDIIATPEDVTPEVFPKLSTLTGLSEDHIRRNLSAPREYPFAPAVIKSDISRELAFKIEELKPELSGVSVRVSGIRYYPYKEIASHLIGYIGKINEREYKTLDRDRYGMTSLIGRAGIEKIFDDELRGWRGGKQLEVDARGNLIRVLSERKPEPGKDLVVTLDLEFQKKIAKLIEGKKAAVAVLDLKTEGLLALVSAPAYDPNIFVMPGHNQERMEVLTDRESPMLERATGSVYPPGSVFKLVTAIAGLETGKITPNTNFACHGAYRIKKGTRPFHCWLKSGHGRLNLYQAIERSCNVYFYNLGKRLSADDIAHYARELGLGDAMQLEVTSIAPGIVPDTTWKKEKYKEKWYKGDTLSFAIGQSYLLTSPIQILRLAAIIAKDGERVEPRLVIDPEDPGPSGERVAIRPENIKVIQKAMLRVVEAEYGTGQFARVDFDKMAAKTGTAQAPPNDAHSWITGFFPYKNPKIAFVVFVEHGGSGGMNAARIAKDMIQAWGDLYVPGVA